MKNLLLAGAFALASLSLPAGATAQDNRVVLTTEQQAMYDAWPMERRTTYDAWPEGVRTYYWTLDRNRQNMYWMMDDADRVRIYEMPMNQRDAAWRQHMDMHAATPNQNASMTTSATSSRINYVGNAMIQQIAMDQAQGEVPVCNRGQTDNCINAWEAGRRGPGVTRPLDHWPGQPASTMRPDNRN